MGEEVDVNLRTVEDMINYLKLDEWKVDSKSKTECSSLVRVVNRMLKGIDSGK